MGVHLIGPHVTEMIAGTVGYLNMEFTVEDIANCIYPHPTLIETIMETAHATGGKAIHI